MTTPPSRPAVLIAANETVEAVPTDPIDVALDLTRIDASTFAANLTSQWWIGRQPFAGIVAALTLRVGELAYPDAQPGTVNLLQVPALEPGRLLFRVAGTPSSTPPPELLMSICADPSGAALVTFVQQEDGSSDVVSALPPNVRGPATYRPYRTSEPGPQFLNYFEQRPLLDEPRAPQPRQGWEGVWVRTKRPRPLDAATATIMADSWFPATHQLIARRTTERGEPLQEVGPMTVIHWILSFTVPTLQLGEYDNQWLLLLQQVAAAGNGGVTENRELWTADNRLVAVGRVTYRRQPRTRHSNDNLERPLAAPRNGD